MTMIIDPSSKTPKSTIFDDIYFSKEDGLGESLYNFFEGNNLPQAWQDKERFTICELGLGTGLNIVLAIDLFLKSKGKCKKLNLISFAKKTSFEPLKIDGRNYQLSNLSGQVIAVVGSPDDINKYQANDTGIWRN